jgi:DNA-binding NarL/FixJ family response regulator
MPGMSGFELLLEIRRRFPSIQAIAMSGAFSGDEVPSGVAADAFYQKGCGVAPVLKIVESLPRSRRILSNDPAALPHISIQPRRQSASEEA